MVAQVLPVPASGRRKKIDAQRFEPPPPACPFSCPAMLETPSLPFVAQAGGRNVLAQG